MKYIIGKYNIKRGRTIYRIKYIEGEYSYHYEFLGYCKPLYTNLSRTGGQWRPSYGSYYDLTNVYKIYNNVEELIDEIFNF